MNLRINTGFIGSISFEERIMPIRETGFDSVIMSFNFSETVKKLFDLDYKGSVSLEAMTDKSRLYSFFKTEKENDR